MTRPPVPQTTADSTSIWSTLRHPAFRGIWLASALYFIANAMHVMAAAWIMVDRAGSSFLAALVQTAVFLPMFALSLPAGVLADTTDRRRLILLSLAVQGAAVLLLALLLVLGWAGPATILLLTFVAGCCIAVMSPAWNSAIAEILPREQLPQAIVAVGIAYNAARALGPTAAGLIYAGVSAWVLADAGPAAAPAAELAVGAAQGVAAGVAEGVIAARAAGWAGGTVLLLALAGVLVLAWAMNHWPARPHPPSRLPPERLWGGTLAGLRYAWHSEIILAQLLRTAAYGGAGSALWALLPSIGAQRLGSGAEGYGLMMGCLGSGAVVVGLGIGPLRQRLGLEGLVATACVVFAAAMAIAALSRCPTLPDQVSWFIATQPIGLAAIFITSSPGRSPSQPVPGRLASLPAVSTNITHRNTLRPSPTPSPSAASTHASRPKCGATRLSGPGAPYGVARRSRARPRP